MELTVTEAEHDVLNPKGINVIRDFRGAGRGVRVWGARTISSDPEWKYVNVRRLFIFLEESITGIVNYLSTTSTRKLTRDIEQLHEKREELKAIQGLTPFRRDEG